MNGLQRCALVFLVGIMIINIGFAGYAAAEKGDKGKDHDGKKDGGKHKGEKSNNSGEDEHGKGAPADSGSNTGPPKGSAPAPQQSEPSPAGDTAAPPGPQASQLGGTQANNVQPSAQQQAVSDSLGVQEGLAKSAASARQAGDSLAIGESAAPKSTAHAARDLADSVTAGESVGRAVAKSEIPVSAGSELRVSDNIAISGTAVPPMAPKISITSPPLLQVSEGQDAEMTFHSTAAGTWTTEIREDGGRVLQTLKGDMSLGANAAAWDGTGPDGSYAPNGQYSYFISAAGPGGTREPPAQGDGAIAVALPGQAAAGQDMNVLLVIPVAAAGAIAFLLLRRRQKPLIFYLPAEAAGVIDDLRERYPDATVEEYVEMTGEGRMQRYKGVTIRRPGGTIDREWIRAEAEKAKEAAEMDSIAVNYRGKLHIL